MARQPIERAICIVDADVSVREALARLLSAAGFRTRSFADIKQFVADREPGVKGCVLVGWSTVGGVGASGALVLRGRLGWPVIVLSESGDEMARQQARTLGARFLLSKPVDAQALLDSIAWVTDEER